MFNRQSRRGQIKTNTESDGTAHNHGARKYQWHQPLYRLAAVMEREAGVGIDRHTLDDGEMWQAAQMELRQAPRD